MDTSSSSDSVTADDSAAAATDAMTVVEAAT
jgi:hypothetical protein